MVRSLSLSEIIQSVSPPASDPRMNAILFGRTGIKNNAPVIASTRMDLRKNWLAKRMKGMKTFREWQRHLFGRLAILFATITLSKSTCWRGSEWKEYQILEGKKATGTEWAERKPIMLNINWKKSWALTTNLFVSFSPAPSLSCALPGSVKYFLFHVCQLLDSFS